MGRFRKSRRTVEEWQDPQEERAPELDRMLETGGEEPEASEGDVEESAPELLEAAAEAISAAGSEALRSSRSRSRSRKPKEEPDAGVRPCDARGRGIRIV